MSSTWQSNFRILIKQFLKASEKDYRVRQAITSFPRYEAYDEWYNKNVRPDLDRLTTQCHGDAMSAGTVWGDKTGVERYLSLASEAGNSLPTDFYPPARLFSSDPLPEHIQACMPVPLPPNYHPTVRLFPHWNELANLNPSPMTLWEEFLFVAQCCHFQKTEDPEWGSRVARLDDNSNPFRVSAYAIEQFLLADSNQVLNEYHETMRSVCDWVKFSAPVATGVAESSSRLPTPQSQSPGKTRRKRGSVPQLLLLFLEDRRNTNLKQQELAEKLKCSPAAICRAFKDPTFGEQIRDRYEARGVKPPTFDKV
jgi:hypothetical protein